MLVVVAVGGNALLERGEVPLAETQEKHVAVAVGALAPLAADHDLVITFGNGPQVGLLANESSADPALPFPYPLDVLARDLGADALVIRTDVANVETSSGTDAAKAIGRTTPAALRALKFPLGQWDPRSKLPAASSRRPAPQGSRSLTAPGLTA